MHLLKHFIKKYFWWLVFHNRIIGKSIRLNDEYSKLLDTTPFFSETKLNIFTVDNEDGILLNIFTKIGPGNRRFVDIGSNDCINSNCANLSFHYDWCGTFVDANKSLINRGYYIYRRHFGKRVNRFSFTNCLITPTNINSILVNSGETPDIDLLSIDLDGNDYHIWESILIVRPRVVVVEVQAEKGNQVFVPTYENVFEPYEDNLPKGASPLSMCNLARNKGYKLVAANRGCYNLFFVREDCMKCLEEISVEEILSNDIM
ncbi:MAG: hypothetical protein QM764_09690 [Chitinophagaceae bacterium]